MTGYVQQPYRAQVKAAAAQHQLAALGQIPAAAALGPQDPPRSESVLYRLAAVPRMDRRNFKPPPTPKSKRPRAHSAVHFLRC